MPHQWLAVYCPPSGKHKIIAKRHHSFILGFLHHACLTSALWLETEEITIFMLGFCKREH